MTTKKQTPAGAGGGRKNNVKSKSSRKTTTANRPETQARRGFTLPKLKPWRKPVDGAALLDDLAAIFRRYLDLPKGAAEAMALWVMFTHAFDAAEVSPRLAITSPTLRCGKTTSLTILGGLVARPVQASNVTPAVVFRMIDSDWPTLLIDEADTFLTQNGELRGILNSGHTRAMAFVLRCVGDEHEPRQFSTWSPVAIAKIRELPATLSDRAIEIKMRRRRRDQNGERFHQGHAGDLEILARKAARWAGDNLAALKGSDPEIPSELHDRAADNWRPLLAIADLSGGDWPEKARRVALLLSAETEPPLAVQILAAIQGVFAKRTQDKISSAKLCCEIRDVDEGLDLTQNRLARELKPFGIRPSALRIGNKTPRGYMVADFEDAFARYLPPPPKCNTETNDVNQ